MGYKRCENCRYFGIETCCGTGYYVCRRDSSMIKPGMICEHWEGEER